LARAVVERARLATQPSHVALVLAAPNHARASNESTIS
jgi:hypothetical protein